MTWWNHGLIAASLLLPLLAAGCVDPQAQRDEETVSDPFTCPAPCGTVIMTGVRWEPHVAVDPNDPLHLVASSQDQSLAPGKFLRHHWADAHVSFDGGATWTTHRIPGGDEEDPSHPLYAYNGMDDSVVTILDDGTVLWSAITWSRSQPDSIAGRSPPALVVLRSHDGGRTFPDVVFVAEGIGWDLGDVQARDSADKQWPTVLPDGRVLMVWSNNKDNHPDCGLDILPEPCTDIVYSVSADSGATWTTPRPITPTIASGAYPLVLRDGTWLVSYHLDQDEDFHVARSDDEGVSWNADKVGDATKFPVMAVTNKTGRVFIAYPGGDVKRDDQQQIHIIHSTDNGTTWSAPLVLDAPSHPGRTIPAIAPAGRDGVVVTYLHPHENGAEVRAVYIEDDAPVGRLTIGNMTGLPRHSGDYMGLAPLGDGDVYAVWNEVANDGTTAVKGARLDIRVDRHP